ncbi:TPA: dATP/dGTP pyrophosphohydrolase domain-containing protein, partial [Klebsiella michiganensis]
MNELTREELLNIIETDHVQCGEASALARMALAAMDSEPVEESVTCWSCRNEVEISAIGDRDGYCPICDAPIYLDEEPYTSPQPAPDREQVRREHAEWSQATFGNVGPVGPLKHL